MSQFKPGEIVIVTNSIVPSIPIGSEVTVRALYEIWFMDEPVKTPCPCCGGVMYTLEGLEYLGCHATLRRRPPEQDWKKLCQLDQVPADCIAREPA